MTPPQHLTCANGAHPWTREPRRGPRPAHCPQHPRPVTVTPVPEGLLRYLAARRDRLALLPEDRSPQRIAAEEAAAVAERNGEAWLVPPTALDFSGLDGDDEAPGFGLVSEGERLGQDATSREISRGAMHTGHPEGEHRPLSCGECFLAAADTVVDTGTHRAHRAS